MYRRLVPAVLLAVILVSSVPVNAAPRRDVNEPSWLGRIVHVIRTIGLLPKPADDPSFPKP